MKNFLKLIPNLCGTSFCEVESFAMNWGCYSSNFIVELETSCMNPFLDFNEKVLIFFFFLLAVEVRKCALSIFRHLECNV